MAKAKPISFWAGWKKIAGPLKLRELGVSARISLMEGAWHSMSEERHKLLNGMRGCMPAHGAPPMDGSFSCTDPIWPMFIRNDQRFSSNPSSHTRLEQNFKEGFRAQRKHHQFQCWVGTLIGQGPVVYPCSCASCCTAAEKILCMWFSVR